MRYRPEIDGLRAIAVISTVFFHAGFNYFSGGFVGVDVFFVISGYLITKIIIEDIEVGSFSFIEFYNRRARRLIPALYFIVGFSIVCVFLVFTPEEGKIFYKSVISTTLFYSNIQFWIEAGYFDISAVRKPLLHTWSLSIEEQFYLLYPLFLLAVLKINARYVPVALIFVGLVSIALAEWAAIARPAANFYLLPTRGWELIIGALCAIYSAKFNTSETPNSFISAGLSFLGLLLIMASMMGFSETTPHPSLYTLFPTIGTAMVILAAKPENLTGRMLGCRPLVGVGVVSYSAYLWHQPIFSISRAALNDQVTQLHMIIFTLLSFILAFFTWRFIEKPFRKRDICKGNKFIVVFLIISSIYVCIGYFGYKTNGFESLYISTLDSRQRSVWESSKDVPYDSGCRFRTDTISKEFRMRFDACVAEHGKSMVVLGDSHGIDLFQALAMNAKEPFVVGLVQGGCRPYSMDQQCNMDEFQKFIIQHSNKLERVFYNQAGRPLLMVANDEMATSASDEQVEPIYTLSTERIKKVAEFLKKITTKVDVLWIGPWIEPEHNTAQVRNMAMACQHQYVKTDEKLSRAIVQLDKYLKNAFQQGEETLMYESIVDSVDFKNPEDIYDCNAIYWLNGDHWSVAGEQRFGKRIVNRLRYLDLFD